MIKQFIFDIGNVLVDFHPVPFFEKLLPGKHMEEVCALVFHQDWEWMDEGRYTCAELRKKLIQDYPIYMEQIHFIFDHWMSMMSLAQDSVDYMKELKEQGYKIYLLSNIGEESYQYLSRKYDFFSLADGMTLSYEIRCNKPKPAIYETLLDTYQLRGEECIFFDDRMANVESARQLGIHAICFQKVEQAKEEVKDYVNHK